MEHTHARRTRLAAPLTALVLLSGWFLGAPAATAAPVSPGPGTLTVSAYDYLTDADADVVAGDPDTNLVVNFTAGRALDDGTLAVALPTRDWPDPLQVGDRLRPNDPTLRGAVVVRPSVDYDVLTDADCRAAGGQTLAVTVVNEPSVRLATVSHLSCAAGQKVSLRIFDVHAPQRIGRTSLLGDVGDANGGTSSVLPLTIHPVPATQLVVQPSDPTFTLTGSRVTFTVTAVRGARNRVDTGYRGTVNLIPVGTDCFVKSIERLPVTFTASDQGSVTVHLVFSAPQRFRIEAYDVARRAQTGYSGDINVVADPDYVPTTCSRAYH